MYPSDDFLPRAPDPEEIVLEGEEAPGPKFEGDNTSGENEKQDVEKAEKEEWTNEHKEWTSTREPSAVYLYT